MADSLQSLEAAGIVGPNLSDEQRQVLASLDPEEVRIITSVKSRLDDAAGDVQGYGVIEDDKHGGLIY